MAKPKSKRGKTPKKTDYDSDDEVSNKKEAVPDPSSNEFYHNEIDDFHAEKQSRLAALAPADSSSDEDNRVEVLAYDDENSSDEDGMTEREMQAYKKQLKRMKQQSRKHNMGSDLESDTAQYGPDGEEMPDEKAWGNRKNQFYGADVSDIDSEDIEFSGSEPDIALLEEREAMLIQKRLIEQLDDDDFVIENNTKIITQDKDIQTVVKDISKMSIKERIRQVKSESPELCNLIEEYKLKMKEVQRLAPIVNHLVGRDLNSSKPFNYCVNLSFYVSLKAQRLSAVNSHPVIKRIVQIKKVIGQFDEMLASSMEPAVGALLSDLANGKDPEFVSQTKLKSTSSSLRVKGSQKKNIRTVSKPKITLNKDEFITNDEKMALNYYDMMKAGKKISDLYDDNEGEGVDEDDAAENIEDQDGQKILADGKRAITYQIEKNKGLTPHRKKENRNPRVKNRMKYRRAIIRRKGGVRENKTEMQRYGGEATGIKAGLIKSTKFKH